MELKQTIDMGEVNALTYYTSGITNSEVIKEGLALLVQQCHAASYNRGWWHDPITGLSLIPVDFDRHDAVTFKWEEVRAAWFPYVIATKIALIHSEISEGLEAYRVDAIDDKIPFPGITAEMGDAVIRIADLMGCLQEYYASITKGEVPEAIHQYNLGAAILAKLPVNAGRIDHDLAKRVAPGGKKF